MKKVKRKSLSNRKRHKWISPPAYGDEGFAPSDLLKKASENFHKTDKSPNFSLRSAPAKLIACTAQ